MEPRKLRRDGTFGRQAVEVCYSKTSVHNPIPVVLLPSFLLRGSERSVLKVVEKASVGKIEDLGLQAHQGPVVHSGIRLSVSLN